MKILMCGRIGLMEVGGGDKIQMQNTAKELEKLGAEVEITTSLNSDFSACDLVHVFQLDWTPETYLYIKKAKRAGKPVVLSPIHHSVKEVERFDNEYAFGYRRLAKVLFKDQHSRDTIKNIYRAIFDPRKIWPTLLSIAIGLKKMHQYSLKNADYVLVQTKLEAQDLKETYNVDFRWKEVPNGVSEIFLHPENFVNPLNAKDYVICVGRIEARKNNNSVLEAVRILRESGDPRFENLNLYFLGRKSWAHHAEYVSIFDSLIKNYKWAKWINEIPYEEMPSYYHNAKVCVSASWFETTGLTLLEAVFCGTNAVAAGERAKEYLGDMASYCDPGSVESISEAIKIEFEKPRPQASDKMRSDFTWRNAAEKTYNVYNMVLGENSNSKK